MQGVATRKPISSSSAWCAISPVLLIQSRWPRKCRETVRLFSKQWRWQRNNTRLHKVGWLILDDEWTEICFVICCELRRNRRTAHSKLRASWPTVRTLFHALIFRFNKVHPSILPRLPLPSRHLPRILAVRLFLSYTLARAPSLTRVQTDHHLNKQAPAFVSLDFSLGMAYYVCLPVLRGADDKFWWRKGRGLEPCCLEFLKSGILIRILRIQEMTATTNMAMTTRTMKMVGNIDMI